MTLSPAQAADELGISLTTFWRLARSGELPTVKASDPDKPGRRPSTRVDEDALREFIASRIQAAAAKAAS